MNLKNSINLKDVLNVMRKQCQDMLLMFNWLRKNCFYHNNDKCLKVGDYYNSTQNHYLYCNKYNSHVRDFTKIENWMFNL